MFQRVLLASIVAISFAVTAPFAAQAQDLFISAGIAVPSGDDMDAFETGWMVAGGVTFDIGENGLWAGVEGAFGRNSAKEEIAVDENIKPFSIMGILGYSFPTEGSVSPYVWGGAGLAGASISEPDVEIDSGFGWQAGAGISFSSGNVRPYVEGRYHSASLDATSDGETESVDFRMFGVLVGASIGVGN